MRILITLALLCTLALPALAGATGNISPTGRYAWSETGGWNDFAPAGGGVTVYNDHLEGYAWGENIGWIKLGSHTGGGAYTYANSTNADWGVNRDASGVLSGYAWSETSGWINFNPSGGGVTINPATAAFSGHAWGENIGWMSFKGTSGDAVPYGVALLGYTVNLLVTGSGWVHGTPLSNTPGIPYGDIACSGAGGGVCTAQYPAGDTITLTATPEGVATQFDSWGSDCAGQGNPCTLNLNGDKTVAALFIQAPLAKNSTKGITYPTLAEALTAANAAIPDGILLLDIGYGEAVTLTKGVKLYGGWNNLYQSLTGLPTFLYSGLTVEGGASTLETTQIGGKLTLKGGTLRVKGVKLSGGPDM